MRNDKKMHEQFMRIALQQAALGRGICAPNPSVGALAVANGEIIACDYHKGAGTLHAEQLVLSQFKLHTPDVTIYVTLEPCNHWGRTPPCVDAIIEHGIKRVVYGYRDPNPIVMQRNTTALLEAHGVEVIFCPLPEVDAFYQSYRVWTTEKRPFVTVKMAQSIDAKIAGPNGARVQITNEQLAARTHRERFQTDVILTTAQTVMNDDAAFNAREEGVVKAKAVAILQGQRALTEDYQVLKTANHIYLFYNETLSMPLVHPNVTAIATPLDNTTKGLSLEHVLDELAHLGFHEVWVEAGARLFNALHEQKQVDRTYIYIAPKVLGEQATPLYNENLFTSAHQCRWELYDDNVLCRLDWREC